jgi:23S rRNA (pseudouridine1915-N3)-methyltransferase
VKLQIRAVGKMRDRRLDEVCREYLDRARRHLPVEVLELETDAALTRQLPAGAEVIALEPSGESWTTAEFTAFLSERMLRGSRGLVFLVGGADGLSRATVGKAHRRLSLSALTLPHRLARVLLCEQIYRCISSVRGEPYNR